MCAILRLPQVNGRKMTEFLTPSCRDNFSSVLLPAVRVTGSSSSVVLQFVARSGVTLAAWVDIVATRRRGVVHRLEVTVTPLAADECVDEPFSQSEDDVDVDEGPVLTGGGSQGSLDTVGTHDTVPSVAEGVRAAGGGPLAPPPLLPLPSITRTLSQMSMSGDDDVVATGVPMRNFPGPQ